MDEMLASLQYLQRVKLCGRSVWKAFWGIDPEQANETPERALPANQAQSRTDAGVYRERENVTRR
jgi:hypothetical protein